MRERLNEWMLVVFVVVAVLSFPLGATAFHFLVRASLAKQQILDTEGVPITARLVKLHLERKFHQDRGVGISDRGAWTEETCHIDVVYSVAGSKAIHRKSTQVDDRSVCKRYRVGDTLSGRAIPNDPKVMLLDKNRTGTHWYWISLLLMVAFIGGPLLIIIKAAYGKYIHGAGGKSEHSSSGQVGARLPSDMDVQDE